MSMHNLINGSVVLRPYDEEHFTNLHGKFVCTVDFFEEEFQRPSEDLFGNLIIDEGPATALASKNFKKGSLYYGLVKEVDFDELWIIKDDNGNYFNFEEEDFRFLVKIFCLH